MTIFDDIALLAPGALLHPVIRWEALDDRSARGNYTAGGITVSAVLHFHLRRWPGGLRRS